mmetsp:Transcript_3700/g.15365  ORF Transcript_3700/g.15365 Transcript_3700/m.15365 type:complete len:227 (+) Transcript_3700:5200-5880(+)
MRARGAGGCHAPPQVDHVVHCLERLHQGRATGGRGDRAEAGHRRAQAVTLCLCGFGASPGHCPLSLKPGHDGLDRVRLLVLESRARPQAVVLPLQLVQRRLHSVPGGLPQGLDGAAQRRAGGCKLGKLVSRRRADCGRDAGVQGGTHRLARERRERRGHVCALGGCGAACCTKRCWVKGVQRAGLGESAGTASRRAGRAGSSGPAIDCHACARACACSSNCSGWVY